MSEAVADRESGERRGWVSGIRAVWCDVLGVSCVDRHSGFFDLGGDSLAAMQMIARLSSELGLRVELGMLFEFPEFGRFVDALMADRQSAAEIDGGFWPINVCRGAVPVFAFAFAPDLGSGSTVYFHPGVYDEIHSNSSVLTEGRLEEILDELVVEIEKKAESGVCRLVGYCHGGWLAMALSRILAQKGFRIDFLGLVEVYPRPDWNRSLWRRVGHLKSFRSRCAWGVYSILARCLELRSVQAMLPDSRIVESLKGKVRHFKSVKCYRDFERRVFSKGTRQPTHLFVDATTLEREEFPGQMRMWNEAARGECEVHPVIAGGHHSARHGGDRTAVERRIVELLNRGSTERFPRPTADYDGESRTDSNSVRNDRHEFFERIEANRRLCYMDATSSREFTFRECVDAFAELQFEDKSLAFVYQDGTVASVSAILGMVNAGNTVALFSNTASANVKEKLETIYSPRAIFDLSRQSISGFARHPLDVAGFVHVRKNSGKVPKIHEKLDVLLSTSGSTGSPKLVKLSIDNLQSNANSIGEYLPISNSDVAPLNLPLDYSYGLSILTSNSLYGGKLVCSVKNIADPAFWDEFRHFGMTTIAGTPDLYYMLREIGFLKWSLPSLRYLTQAGGALDAGIVREFGEYAQRHGKQFFVMYGQTEATARMAYLPPDMLSSHAGSIGFAIPGGRFRIDADTGELVYQGANIFGGYLTDPEGLSEYESPEELFTGDRACVDEQGVFRITGRLKRFVKLMGVRVNLDELEQVLNGSRLSSRFACTRGTGEVLNVFQEGDTYSADEILRELNAVVRIPPQAIAVRSLDRLPVNSNGKIEYSKLSE